ncbi:hypothetical protein B0H19DRAFT_1271209 [Mycena capillaripes]|nr:hypothetical protein B0H19DRAFT_1271209 [Mycena capillaripes]
MFPLARFHPPLRAESSYPTLRDAFVCARVAAPSARCRRHDSGSHGDHVHHRLHVLGTHTLVHQDIAARPLPRSRPTSTTPLPVLPHVAAPLLLRRGSRAMTPCSLTPTSTRATSSYSLLSAPILPLWAWLDTRPPNNALVVHQTAHNLVPRLQDPRRKTLFVCLIQESPTAHRHVRAFDPPRTPSQRRRFHHMAVPPNTRVKRIPMHRSFAVPHRTTPRRPFLRPGALQAASSKLIAAFSFIDLPLHSFRCDAISPSCTPFSDITCPLFLSPQSFS